MSTGILGYNVALKIGEKTIVGTTSNSFDIKPVVKESITKDDRGTKKKKVVSNDFSFSVDAVASLIDAGDVATKLGRDEVIALVLAKAAVDFTYLMDGAKGYQGSAIISSYSEKSDSENEVTFSLNLDSNSELTPIAE